MAKKYLMAHERSLKKAKNVKIAEAIKIVDGPFKRRKMGMILAYNPAEGDDCDKEVCLTVTICDKRNSELPPGVVEYNVCNGLPGNRSESLDYYDLDLALALFDKIARHGWHETFKKERQRADRFAY